MNKNFIKTITFITIFFMLLSYVIKILWLPPSPISDFYKEPKNSLDVIYIGSSNVFVHFNPVLAYETQGITTGMMSTNSQPIVLTKYLIEESRKTQNPKIYIIDLARAVETLDQFSEENIRQTTDEMKFSKNRINAINDTLSYKEEVNKKDYINFYFSFLMYHNKWKSISGANLTNVSNLYKGFWFHYLTTKTEPQEKFVWKQDYQELDTETKKIFLDLINYIKSNNLRVLFVIPPRKFNEKINSKLNTLIMEVQENNLDIINFNTYDEFIEKIDYSTDYYNEAHFNIYGSTKFTLYFSKYLREKYNLPSHKDDEKYKSWNEEYERFKERYTKETNREFNDLLELIYKIE